MEQPTYTNRLAQEKSPYLLQHKNNPVDWYPWTAEAFEKAKAEDKPIFLSIGYSTCHWCHVMEKESFEDEEVAELLNKDFVSIKVDREERPDVDQVYMQAVIALAGSGGWPMSVFLTPDKKPFYGGTYFPKRDNYGRPGFMSILAGVAGKWKTDKDKIIESGAEIQKALADELQKKSEQSRDLTKGTLTRAYEQYMAQFDLVYAGFGQAPKFPRTHVLGFLLRYYKNSDNARALEMTEKTLKTMAEGGIFDHLGGGFHRYSTDAEWHVPHFEKMLYDQALVSRAYAEAYQITGNESYATVLRETFDYVLRDMTHESGGFYSAEDADSAPDASKPEEKKEGAFYVWGQEEVKSLLGEREAAIFNFYFDVKEQGNAAHDPHQEFTGKNILRIKKTLLETAKQFKEHPDTIETILREAKAKLYEVRQQRPKPHLDDKILTDWNGLMIASLAYGGRALGEERYIQAAQKCADFILSTMKDGDTLLHRYREGDAGIQAFHEDYVFLTLGLLELYEATYEAKYLEEAKRLAHRMVELFWDESQGGFLFVGKGGEEMIYPVKEVYDGALPSGNSMAAWVLARLGRLTMDPELEKKSSEVLGAFSTPVEKFPSAYPQMMMALDFVIHESQEIVIAADKQTQDFQTVETLLSKRFMPNAVVALNPTNASESAQIQKIIPFLEKQTAVNDKTTVYVCKNYVCDLPITNPDQLEDKLP